MRLFAIDEDGNRKELQTVEATSSPFPWHFVISAVSVVLNVVQAVILILDKS